VNSEFSDKERRAEAREARIEKYRLLHCCPLFSSLLENELKEREVVKAKQLLPSF
jgi:hypothetical protein